MRSYRAILLTAASGASVMCSVSARCEEPASPTSQSTNSAAADSHAPIVAQQASAQSTSAIDGSSSPYEIVVTAQHRSEPLQRVPLAVTVIGGVALEQSGTNLQTALPRVVPNLRINENSGFVSPYIRGVGTEYANPGLESSVATYLDDIYIARPYFTLSSFADLDHVEVLKGPQGTLYGRNATGGVLRIITNDPTDKLEAKASVTYGRYNRVAGDLVINTPIATNILSRFTISYDRNDGYTHSISTSSPTTNNRNYLFMTEKVVIKPASNVTIKLAADYSHKLDYEGQGWVALTNKAPGQTGIVLGGAPSPNFYTTSSDYYGERPGGNLETLFGSSVRVNVDLPTLTLSSISGYRFTGDTSYADLDVTSAPFLNAATLNEKSRSYSQELQALSNNSGPVKYVFGLYYYRERSTVPFGVYGSAINGALGVPTGPKIGAIDGGPGEFSRAVIGVSSIAPYGQATYQVTSRFDITVGARYTIEQKKELSHVVTIQNLGPTIVLIDEPTRETKFKQFTPKATLNYKLTDRSIVYATYSKGFKSGGFNSIQLTTLSEVKPETLDDFDVGYKWQHGAFHVSLAAFYYKYKDLQVSYVDSMTGASTTENAANANVYGGEIEGSARLTNDFTLSATGGYLHARYKDYHGTAFVPSASPIGGFDAVSEDLSGNRLTQSPTLSGSMTGQYEQALANGSKVGLNSTLSYSSSYYFDGANQIREPARALLSADLSFTSSNGRYRIEAFGDNITNKRYRLSAQFNNYGGFYVPASPATWGIKGTVRY